MQEGLELLAEQAAAGDKSALAELVERIRGDVERLASRMLGHPSDAEDACQEILIKVVTHLASFRGESAFRTWVWRVACNHLLATRRSRAERAGHFSILLGQSDGETRFSPQPSLAPDQALLMERVRSCCARGFYSLDRDHRIALTLSDFFDLTSEEGAEVLSIKPAAFRKRLSRAKERLRGHLNAHCGLVGRARGCRSCLGARADPGPAAPDPVEEQLREMENLSDAASALRAQELAGGERLMERVRRLLSSGRYPALES